LHRPVELAALIGQVKSGRSHFPVRRLIVHYERVVAVIEMLRNHVKYHQGKGETITAKKLHVDIGRPKDIRIEVVAAQESGRARAT